METPAIQLPRTPRRQIRSCPRSLIALILSCVFLTPITAQQPLPLTDAATQGQTMFEQSGATAMVLVVVRNQEVLIKGYGETYPGSGHSPDANSVVRLCSVSKVLTSDLLLKLVDDGTVKLTDPLQKYAPPGMIVPTETDQPDPHAATEITLRALATHTAGLTREISSYPRKTPHFTFPDFNQRWDWLPDQKLISAPDSAAFYSNVGFDLLGDALASASHKPYAALLHDRLLKPLRMWDTTLYPSPGQCARLLQGSGNEGPCTSTEQSGASGGVYSTPADMARYIQYLLHLSGPPTPPPPALAAYLDPKQLKSVSGLDHAGNPTGIGLAWIQIGDPNTPSVVFQKTGGGAGFTTYIALSPSRQTGVFLAFTEGKGKHNIDPFFEGNNLLTALANVPPLPQKTRPAPRRHAKRRARPTPHAVPHQATGTKAKTHRSSSN
jgi:serine-type D-Ala-D-Ala carboxypeptidase/endopeptidase